MHRSVNLVEYQLILSHPENRIAIMINSVSWRCCHNFSWDKPNQSSVLCHVCANYFIQSSHAITFTLNIYLRFEYFSTLVYYCRPAGYCMLSNNSRRQSSNNNLIVDSRHACRFSEGQRFITYGGVLLIMKAMRHTLTFFRLIPPSCLAPCSWTMAVIISVVFFRSPPKINELSMVLVVTITRLCRSELESSPYTSRFACGRIMLMKSVTFVSLLPNCYQGRKK